MFKKALALVLCLMILLNAMPTHDVFASDLSAEIVTKIQTSKAYTGNVFDDELLLNSSVSVSDIESYLINELEYPSVTGNKMYKLNPYVFQKYKIVAYTDEEAYNEGIAGLTTKGSPKKESQTIVNDDFTSQTLSVYEYRYLGYQQNGKSEITNDFYPADSKDFIDPKDRKWIFNDLDKLSWNKETLENDNMLNYLLKSNVQNDDVQDGVFEKTDYSIADITNVSNLDTLVKFPKVMADVNFTGPGVLQMAHLRDGNRWYDTMRLEQYNYDLGTRIDNVKTDVKLPVGTESYEITYDVTTAISNLTTDDSSRSGRYFKTVEIEGVSPALFTNEDFADKDLPTLKKSLVKSVDLKGMKVGESKPFKLNAVSVVETFDKGVRTAEAETVTVNITLVADDAVDFVIKKNETDITGANVTVNNLEFSTPLTVTLEDTSFIQSDVVTGRDWYVQTPSEWRHIQGGNEETIQYTLASANRNLLIDGKVSFRLVVYTVDGSVGNSEQFILPIEKKTSNESGGVVAVLTSSAEFDEKKEYYEVMEGETFTLRGNKSYHEKDLKITDYEFDVGEDFNEGIIIGGSKKSARAFYPKSDGGAIYRAYLTVTDEVGATDDTYVRTKVHPACFEPLIDIYGSFKENRKLSFFVSNSNNLTYYPIDEGSLEWAIIPLDGQGDAVRVDGSLTESSSFDALLKKHGRYKVHVEGDISSPYNAIRYHGSAEKIITIAEDIPPMANFVVKETEYRDVENGLMTKLVLHDLSRSVDGDRIVQRVASVKFDTDNDHEWDDETSIVFNAGNETTVYYQSDHVGDYKFELTVKEEFGQPTISKFIDDADKKRGNTNDKALGDKITKLANRPPVVDLEISQRKNVNVVIYEDLGTADKTALESKIAELETGLSSKKIDLNAYYLSPTETVGSREEWTTYFDSYINVKIHVVGQDEDRDDIDHIEEMRFLLDSYSSEGTEKLVGYKDLNRFELIDVEWGKTGYEKYKYKGRTLDYTEYDWQELIVTYKENGVEKKKTYKFVYDYEYSDEKSYYVDEDGYDYDTYDVIESELIVDEPSRSRKSFVVTDSTFSYGAPDKPKINLPTDTKNTVDVKKYKDSELDDILNKCKDEDTFFINLASKKENRIALDTTLVDRLKDNGVNYLTIDDYALSNNPITGEPDELFIDKDGDFYISVGKTIYKLLISARYFNYSKQLTIAKVPFTSVKNKELINLPSFFDKYGTVSYTVYTNGFKDYIHTKYGLEALNAEMYDKNHDDYDYMRTRSEQDVRDAMADPNVAEYAIGKNLFLNVEKDGTLVGQSYRVEDEYYSRYNYIRVYKRYISLGTGWKGLTRFKIDAGDDFESRGLIHSNGNIYFKKPTRYHVRYGVRWGNHLVINDGTANIEYMYYNTSQNKIYVETKEGKLYRYDGLTGSKTLLLDSFKERIGHSYKIGDGQWMIDGKIYNYKEVLSNDGDPYVTRYQYTVYSTTTFYLNEQDEYHMLKKNYKGTTLQSEDDYLIAEDVKTIFLKGYEEAYELKNFSTYTDNDTYPVSVIQGNDGHYYSVTRNLKYHSSDYTDEIRYSPSNFLFIGNWNWTDVGDKNRSYNYQLYAEQLETGLGIRKTLSAYPESFAYARLTGGSATDCVGDGELVGVTSLSSSFNTLSTLTSELLDIYEDYSTSEKMTVLLGEVVDTAMIMQDVENDPAYSMELISIHTDPNYYENSLGRDPQSGLKAISRFDYVGVYRNVPKVRDNPVGEDDRFHDYRLWNKDKTYVDVYVHRRPVGKMRVLQEEIDKSLSLSFKDKGSYDLDHESLADKGIVKWEWSIKEKNESHWNKYYGKECRIEDLSMENKYDVFMRVQDMEGAWSIPIHQEIDPAKISLELTAEVRSTKPTFHVSKMPITESYRVYGIETSYPKPLGLEIGLYRDGILKSDIYGCVMDEGVTGTYVDSEQGSFRWKDYELTVGEKLADGPYQIKVHAYDLDNPLRETVCFLDVGVRTPIDPEPAVPEVFINREEEQLTCTTSIYTDSVEVTLYKGTDFESTSLMEEVEPGGEEMDGDVVRKRWNLIHAVSETVEEGLYDVAFTGRVDTSPKKEETVIKKVRVIPLGIESVELKGAWQHWRGQTDLFGQVMADMPYRFLSWEKIYFTVVTSGSPDRVYVDMSPALEAMSFEDENGTVFDYEDDFGERVDFPLVFQQIEENLWIGEYILPLAHSTLSWQDERLRPAYEMLVRAEKNGLKRTFEFSEDEGRGIDITGNTTNLIYEQPVRTR